MASTDVTEPMGLKKFLLSVVLLNDHCKKRCLEKMEATKHGFGVHNHIESIEYNTEGVSITIVDAGYDLRDTTEGSLSIDEILMTDNAWHAYMVQLKADRISGNRR